jgi:hypothetical protein
MYSAQSGEGSERRMSVKKRQSDEEDRISGAQEPETPQAPDRTDAEAFRSACRHYARRAAHLRG